MVRVRILDERLVTLQRQGRIGFHIGSLGEEAAILGSRLRDARAGLDLPLLPRVRRGAAGAGMPLQRYVDNMFGNANDTGEGPADAGPLLAGSEAHFGSISSPIGTQITQAVGFAWAAKIEQGRPGDARLLRRRRDRAPTTSTTG